MEQVAPGFGVMWMIPGEYSRSCLRCPLPVCKYDDPVAALIWWYQQTGVRVTAAEALSPEAIGGKA
jgi:hypothetical protein